ncbi:hypothetical protein EI171_11155 [Bradyrhizobium sp. LCT2]|uniref:hypothetical protein n=1 Tax=Bradyrhizobium sp. LCT2 TaxID=2493093 RepID=UPI001374110F|nr:hypothetical protein [Bradyrhizobium sp. LCT2]QHP67882.1 hypothetical protein EI171_11155 [Bradyrhizobium sp. LCT2]
MKRARKGNVPNCYRDHMVRVAYDEFYLVEEPTEPGEPVCEIPYSLSEVFDWYDIEPWQIERPVISGI